jgi:uncharacterized membrane protein
VSTRILAGAAAFLALLGIALSIEHLLDGDPYNPGFTEFPAITRAHVVLGAAYLAMALAQLAPGLRARRPALHRKLGRIAATAGIVAGVAALAMMILFPFAGRATPFVAGPFACVFVFALARGVTLARSGRYAEHREWMIRAFAIGTAIATMRLLFVPALFWLGEATAERARPLSVVCFGLAFTIHAAVAELEQVAQDDEQGAARRTLGDGAERTLELGSTDTDISPGNTAGGNTAAADTAPGLEPRELDQRAFEGGHAARHGQR